MLVKGAPDSQDLERKIRAFHTTVTYFSLFAAIFGYNFCRAAARGFSLVVSNVLRVAAINSVGAFVLVLGKVGVVAIVIVIGYEFFIHVSSCFHVT